MTYNLLVTQGGGWGFYVRSSFVDIPGAQALTFVPQITQTIAVKYGGTHSKAWHTNFPRTFEYV